MPSYKSKLGGYVPSICRTTRREWIHKIKTLTLLFSASLFYAILCSNSYYWRVMSKCWNQRERVDINGALFTEIIFTVLTEEGKKLMWMTTACFSLIVSFLLNCKASVGSLLFNRHWRNYTLRTILVKLCASRQCLAENSRENAKAKWLHNKSIASPKKHWKQRPHYTPETFQCYHELGIARVFPKLQSNSHHCETLGLKRVQCC